jgi:CDP-diglyceride synthetase
MTFFLAVAWHEYLSFRLQPVSNREWILHGGRILFGVLPSLLCGFGYPLEVGVSLLLLGYLCQIIVSLTKHGTLSKVVEEMGFFTLGLLYLTGLFSLLVGLQLRGGHEVIWFAFLVVGISDTVAYFAGRAMGKTPFFQNISPSKTQEGFMAGVAGGALGAVLLRGVFSYFGHVVPGYGTALLLGLIVAIVSAFGDLFESMLKRNYGVKDSGRLILGHGGVMDRFDAVLFAAVPLFFFVVLRGGFR